MSDNQANPLKGAETDVSKAADSILGLLTPQEGEPKKEEQKEIQQNSPEPTQEESSNEDQPQEQEISEETEAEEGSRAQRSHNILASPERLGSSGDRMGCVLRPSHGCTFLPQRYHG